MHHEDQCLCNHLRGEHNGGGLGECVYCAACTHFVCAVSHEHVICTEEMLDPIVSVGTGKQVGLSCRHCGKTYSSVGVMHLHNWKKQMDLENAVALARVRLPEILKDIGGLAER